jgi:hypothetical protein
MNIKLFLLGILILISSEVIAQNKGNKEDPRKKWIQDNIVPDNAKRGGLVGEIEKQKITIELINSLFEDAKKRSDIFYCLTLMYNAKANEKDVTSRKKINYLDKAYQYSSMISKDLSSYPRETIDSLKNYLNRELDKNRLYLGIQASYFNAPRNLLSFKTNEIMENTVYLKNEPTTLNQFSGFCLKGTMDVMLDKRRKFGLGMGIELQRLNIQMEKNELDFYFKAIDVNNTVYKRHIYATQPIIESYQNTRLNFPFYTIWKITPDYSDNFGFMLRGNVTFSVFEIGNTLVKANNMFNYEQIYHFEGGQFAYDPSSLSTTSDYLISYSEAQKSGDVSQYQQGMRAQLFDVAFNQSQVVTIKSSAFNNFNINYGFDLVVLAPIKNSSCNFSLGVNHLNFMQNHPPTYITNASNEYNSLSYHMNALSAWVFSLGACYYFHPLQ